MDHSLQILESKHWGKLEREAKKSKGYGNYWLLTCHPQCCWRILIIAWWIHLANFGSFIISKQYIDPISNVSGNISLHNNWSNCNSPFNNRRGYVLVFVPVGRLEGNLRKTELRRSWICKFAENGRVRMFRWTKLTAAPQSRCWVAADAVPRKMEAY